MAPVHQGPATLDVEMESSYGMRNNMLSPIDETQEDEFTYYTSTPDSLGESVLQTLGRMTGARRRRGEYNSVQQQSRRPTRFEKSIAAHGDRRWSSYIAHITRRAVVVGPILALVLFGIIHVLQVAVGRTNLFWDDKHDVDFLPEWGMPGHAGENVAHYPTDATRDVIPVSCHSHNDYWRRIPLFEAIHAGCTGVEADVWLYGEELYVGHSTAALTRNRTFRSLYVNPLVDLLDNQNPKTDFTDGKTRHGVFDTDSEQTLVLLVDFKTDGYKTWPYVESQLNVLREKNYLTYFNGTTTIRGPITVVGTGNTPFDLVLANSTYRDIFFDAPLDRLWESSEARSPSIVDDETLAGGSEADVLATDASSESKSGQGSTGLEDVSHHAFDASNSYYASVDFASTVGFVWRGHLSPQQMETIRGQIAGAKRRGLKSRYWNTPPWPISARNHIWHVLMKEGADVLNVDDLYAATHLDWRKWNHDLW